MCIRDRMVMRSYDGYMEGGQGPGWAARKQDGPQPNPGGSGAKGTS